MVGGWTTIKGDWDDVDVAMVCATAIAVVSAVVMGKDAIPIVMAMGTGILALARGEKRHKNTGGL